jgi:phenylalanyl-tRNA synthetase beta chain
MKVLLSWLREFVDAPADAEDIAATMSVRGFAVESIDTVGRDDAVIDFEVTANRPDCMSVTGMAREVATACGLPAPREPQRRALDSSVRAEVAVAIDDAGRCPRFAAAVADVTPGPSPDWMQARLRAAGVRPISNVVDITNYVMLELGQPMHAYDLARLSGPELRARTARPGETLTTLDGQRRQLSPDMLVIADAERAVGIGGVMGGADSEVGSGTRAIVLEAAYFNPLSVRRTSKTLNLKTEASTRFERGADPNIQANATRSGSSRRHGASAARRLPACSGSRYPTATCAGSSKAWALASAICPTGGRWWCRPAVWTCCARSI